jgi:hypothetical protein
VAREQQRGIEAKADDVDQLQLEFGTKIISVINRATFVFASLWPSWMYAAKAAGHTNLIVHVEDERPRVREILQATMPDGGRVLDWQEWREALCLCMQNEEEAPLVLVQGPRASVNRVLDHLTKSRVDTKRVEVLAFPTSELVGKRPARKRQKLMTVMGMQPIATLHHQCVGGVIDHAWTLESNLLGLETQRDRMERPSRVRARLSDYLVHTEGGMVVSAPKDQMDVPVSKVPWKHKSLKVLSRSVFATTGWVRRNITLKELMDVYDVGVGDRKKMLQVVSNHQAEGFPEEFVQQVPMRVLLRVLEVLNEFQTLSKDTKMPTSEIRDLEDGQNTSTLEQKLKSKQGIQRVDSTRAEGVSDGEKLHSKNDDAEARVVNWNVRVCERLGREYVAAIHDKALDSLRKLELSWSRSNKWGVIRSFRRYMAKEYGLEWLSKVHQYHQGKWQIAGKNLEEEMLRDYEVGIDAISRALAASFWDWDDGSTVFFWRWPEEHRKELRDGLKVWVRHSALPKYWGRQRWPADEGQRTKLKEKISKVLKRRYITTGFVRSLTGFFAVPKGVGDIRVVYDATKSGLNLAIWAPRFFLPSMASVLQKADDKTYYGDIDIGEMFLNYFLDPKLRPWAGVDISELSAAINPPKDAGQRKILRWDRSLMGVRSSPFNCVRAYLISEEVIKGNRKEKNNPFRWDRVKFNLPGQIGYDPSKPWMFCWDDVDQVMASFVISYVDDLRTGSNRDKQDCERVTHVSGSKLNYLGEQDASRKRGEASQTPGAWAGSVVVSVPEEGLYVTVSQEKWDKTKKIIEFYVDKIEVAEKEKGAEVWLDYKQLERDTGFLVHVLMTYDQLRPYLKGFYLTLNSWRFNRGPDGWGYQRSDWEELAEEFWNEGEGWEEVREEYKRKEQAGAPGRVQMMAKMKEDVGMMNVMFQGQTPSRRLIRGFSVARLLYGFGDASGAGFGASWVDCQVGQSKSREVHYRFGRWGSEVEGKSSNFRELCNLVDTLKHMAEQDELRGVEIFLFTDNSTAEAAFNRGSLSNKELFDMVKQVKVMEMLYLTRVHIIHVAGKRMIEQGTDGLSRGCLTDGVMVGKDMTSFVPLHQGAIERSRELLPWLQEGIGHAKDQKLEVLEPEDWFEKGHDISGGTVNCDGVWTPTYAYGNFVWSPPPVCSRAMYGRATEGAT